MKLIRSTGADRIVFAVKSKIANIPELCWSLKELKANLHESVANSPGETL